jgi:hypothetical protein
VPVPAKVSNPLKFGIMIVDNPQKDLENTAKFQVEKAEASKF